MQDAFRVVHKVARSASPVLICGESGTGKELLARALHVESERGARPLYAVNVAALPESLLETELFGYEQGAFPGADQRKAGVIEQASGSTLFIDDVAELPRELQVRLLAVLQDKQLLRVGGSEPVPVDVRVVAATKEDLERAVREGSFRVDLFHRLSVIPIVLPPLRQRRTDIPLLVEHFVRKHGGGRQRYVSDAALKMLSAYDWPGNVRQLESVLERSLLLALNETISPDDLPAEIRAGISGSRGLLGLDVPDEGIDLEAVERSLILRAVEKAEGNLARAAHLLSLSRRALQERIEKIQGATALREHQ
jgi:transcriptional regulator with PAS, ATPase and Fis domain